MLVIPARPAGRRRHHADRLVIDALDLIALAVLPRREAELFRPRVSVAFAFYADENRSRGVRMRLGIMAVLVLADPQIKGVAGHERLDAAPARRTAVVERQVAIDDIGNEIGAPHGEPAHRIGLDVVLVLVEIVGARETVAELIRAIEDHLGVVDEVHQIRCRGAGQQQSRRRAGIDDAVHGVDGDRKQRALLPLKHVALGFAVEPDLGRAAAFDDQIDLFVDVLLGKKRAGAWHLDDVGAPFAFGTVELDIAAASAEPRPRRQRQVLHLAHADIPIDRDVVGFHEKVVRRLRSAELAKAGAFESGRLVPVNLAGDLVHGHPPDAIGCAKEHKGAAGLRLRHSDGSLRLPRLSPHVQCAPVDCNATPIGASLCVSWRF